MDLFHRQIYTLSIKKYFELASREIKRLRRIRKGIWFESRPQISYPTLPFTVFPSPYRLIPQHFLLIVLKPCDYIHIHSLTRCVFTYIHIHKHINTHTQWLNATVPVTRLNSVYETSILYIKLRIFLMHISLT